MNLPTHVRKIAGGDDPMSLSQHLRDAAIERARRYGDIIDSCVLGPDGVVDLRVIDDSSVEAPSTQPASALSHTAGGFENVNDINELFDRPPRLGLRNGRHRLWQ